MVTASTETAPTLASYSSAYVASHAAMAAAGYASATPSAPAPNNDDTARVGAREKRKFLIGGDALNLTDLTESQADDARWLWKYLRDRDMGRSDCEKVLRKPGKKVEFYSYDSIYQLLTGRRKGDQEPICAAIAALRREAGTKAASIDDGYQETRGAREIHAYARKAQETGAVGLLVGDMAWGKTTALLKLAETDARVVYVRMPTGGKLTSFLPELARRLAMSHAQNVKDLQARVIAAFRPGMLLVIDELDQTLGAMGGAGGRRTLNFLRELWDRAQCGLLFVVDSAGKNAIRNGPDAHELKRLWRRRLPYHQLPPVPYEEDLALFASAAGLPPVPDEMVAVQYGGGIHRENPKELQARVLADPDGGLFIWLQLLRDAREMAQRKKATALTWGAVIAAHAAFVAAELKGAE